MDWDSVTLLILISIAILTCITIIGSLLYSNHSAARGHKIKALILNLTYCSTILFLICSAANLLNFEIITDLDDITYIIWNNIAVLSWNFAQILVFILLLLRIYHTFNDTVYRVSNFVYILFIFLLFLYILCCVIWVIQWGCFLKQKSLNHQHEIIDIYQLNDDIEFNDVQFDDIQFIYFMALEVLDLLISALLIILFIKQMIKVTVDLRDDPYRGRSILSKESSATLLSSSNAINEQHRSAINLNHHQLQLLDVATKYSVLSVVATFGTQINTLIYCSILIIDRIYPGDWEILFGSFGKITFCIDCIINPLCLFLLFAINRRIYKYLCNRCHLLFGICLKKITQKRVKKKYIKGSGLQIMQFVYEEEEEYDQFNDS